MLRMFGDPVLSEKCLEVGAGVDVGNILRVMADELAWHYNGVGLAAPQIGVLLRMLIWVDPNARKYASVKSMVNPVLLEKFGDIEVAKEGCLSYPGVFVDVPRSHGIVVSFTDGQGIRREGWRFVGFTARIIQHELDHLDGICLVGDAWRKAVA